MSETPRVVLAIVGATAVGKTDAALALAERLPVALISLDSAMVYRGLDIGTAKPDASVRARHPHALVDLRDPADVYSVADFLADADTAVRAALDAGRIPVLVGGTMLYLRAFREGLSALPGADREVRTRLDAEGRASGWPALHRRLEALDPVAAARIHPHNKSRLQRALEVYEVSGRPISSFWRSAAGVRERLGLTLIEAAVQPDDRAALRARIEMRLDHMLHAGFVEEVAALRARGDLSADLPALRAVGYRQIWDYLEGNISRDEMRERALAATRQLAKRQLTWLRSWPTIRSIGWGDPESIAAELGRLLELAFH